MNSARLSAEQWRQARRLLDEVIELAPPDREKILAHSSAGAEALAEVRALLAAADDANTFMEGEVLSAQAPDAASYASLAPGSVVGAFAVEALVGRGGHGEVYRAARADGHFDQVVALKLLRPEAIDFFQRFQTERQILADLDHPGIARLIDGGIAPDGRPYTVMEFVEGWDIDLYCIEQGLNLGARLELFRQVCEAVAHAHRHLVIHRDLKPANIRVTPEGQAKLLDFGIARLMTGSREADLMTQALITPAYAAPEQMEGALPTTATDVYSLGAILCELLTGSNPWQPGQLSASVMLRRFLEDDPPAASALAAAAKSPPVSADRLRGDLDAIVMKAMRREPGQRYDTPLALWQDIERHLQLKPVLARAGTPGYLLRRFLRRNRSRLAAVAAVVIALLAGTAGVVWQIGQTAIQRQAALGEARRVDAARDQIMLLFRGASGADQTASVRPGQLLDRASATLLADLDAGRHIDPLLMSVLAEFYVELDDVKGAEPLLDRSLDLAKRDGAVDEAARARQAIAAIRLSEGRLDEAQDLLAQARTVWNSDPARYARDLIECHSVEAALLRERGQRDAAIALLQPLPGEADAVGGANSTEGTIILHNLGVHFIEAGRIADADTIFGQAWQRVQARGQELTPIGLSVAMNRAGIAYRQGRIAEAEAGFRDVLARRLALFGSSTATAVAQMNLGRLLTSHGAFEEALPLIEAALATAIDAGGQTSALTVGIRQSKATILLSLQRLPEAQKEIEESLAAAGQGFGKDHPYYAVSLALHGRLMLMQGQFDKAQSDLNAADTLFAAIGEAGKPQRAEIATLRGQLAAARGGAQSSP